MSSSQSILSSFNPHAVHPFTAAGTSQSPAHHHPARTPKPSSHPSQAQTITYNSTASQQPPHTSPTQTTVQSPQPRPASKHPPSSQPIFTPFRLERSSPELRDILVKKHAPAWPVKATNGTQPANGVGSNAAKK